MNIDFKAFLAKEGKKIRLKSRPTKVEPLYSSKQDYRKKLAAQEIGRASCRERV